jgi:hypothetical protein
MGLTFTAHAAEKASAKTQVVDFSESEVPHFQAVKKNGKMTAVMVTPKSEKISDKQKVETAQQMSGVNQQP